MKIAIGCDPNAQDMKHEVIEELESLGFEVTDFGSEDPIYAKVAIRVAEAVANKEYERGIVLCGTGIGVSIAANKVPGIYCALVTDTYQAERAVLSNNANMIALGAQVTGMTIVRQIVRIYMSNAYVTGGRSEPKIGCIVRYEHEKNL